MRRDALAGASGTLSGRRALCGLRWRADVAIDRGRYVQKRRRRREIKACPKIACYPLRPFGCKLCAAWPIRNSFLSAFVFAAPHMAQALKA